MNLLGMGCVRSIPSTATLVETQNERGPRCYDLLRFINPKDKMGMTLLQLERVPFHSSKETLGRRRKTGEDPAPLLPGVLSMHPKDKVARSHSHVIDGELGFARELLQLSVGIQ